VLWIGIRTGIRIRIDLAVLDTDPNPYWECGSGSGPRSMNIGKYLLINLVACPKSFCTFVYVCFLTFYVINVYFSCKNFTLCDFKIWSWSGSGSPWICFGWAPWIRIQICIEIKSWIRILIYTTDFCEDFCANNCEVCAAQYLWSIPAWVAQTRWPKAPSFFPPSLQEGKTKVPDGPGLQRICRN
jgi:hypothetical protein